MLKRVLGLMTLVIGLIVVAGTPAYAHVNVDTSCTGYTLDVFWENLSPNTAFVVDYRITLTKAGSPPIVINSSNAVTTNASGIFGFVLSRDWADHGVTINGTYNVTASATLKQSGVTLDVHQGVTTPTTLVCESQCTGAMGDFVWNDLDRDGIQDVGEPGMPGVTVQLWDGTQSSLLQSTTTDANGLYLFSGLCANTYVVLVPNQPGTTGRTPSPVLQGGNPGLDSNTNPVTVPLPPGATDRTIDFGFFIPPPHLTITKTPKAGTFTVGAQIAFTLVVTNDGQGPATNVRISDQLPTSGGLWWSGFVTSRGTCALSVTSLLTCDIGTLFTGESATVTVSSPNTTPASACQLQANMHGIVTADGGLMAEDSGDFSCTPPPLPCPAGLFNFSFDASGNLNIIYDQFPAPNDNSYGVNAVGWTNHSHRFSDLVGSDHAGFQLRDGSGVIKLSFNVDYITANLSAPSGYSSLGVSGGEGKMLVGTATGIIATTSLDRNLNGVNLPGLFNASHVQQFGSVNVLVDSPPTDAAHTTYSNSDPALAGWDFHNTYFVTITAAKLASLGFNAATWAVEPNLSALHNSPAKECPPPTPQGQGLSVTKRETKDKDVKITIQNSGSVDEFITALQITWPSSNGKLREVKLDGDVIYSGPDIAPGSATLTLSQLVADANKRKIGHGSSDVLKFSFEKNVDPDLTKYTGSVSTSGFVLTIMP